MQQLLSESVQASVRPHECFDTYYADPKNSKVQCFPAVVENRFVTALPSLTSGSTSTITFNPDGQVSDIIVTAALPIPAIPTGGAAAGEGLGLQRGWLYQMVQSISIRYAGSSLYFFGGEQELIECLAECEDSVKRDNLLSLGGGEITSSAAWAQTSLRQASIYIKLPHNSPSAQEKPIGMPTDCFSAPLQVQIQWKPFSSVFLWNATTGATAAAVAATIPTQFASAQMQFKQAHLADRSDGAAVREDLSKHALSIPLKNFMQYQFTAALPSQATPVYQCNLTGFRSGSVQGIMVWAVRNSDLSSNGGKNPLNYLPLQSVTLSVNGLVYFSSQNGNSQLWNLVEKKTASMVSTTALTWDTPSQAYTVAGNAAYWTWIPFAQGVETLRDESDAGQALCFLRGLVHGRQNYYHRGGDNGKDQRA